MAKSGAPIIEPYNPLDKVNIAKSIAEAAIASPVHPLPPEPFIGAGVYMIYYTGDFPVYSPMADRNRDGQYNYPIYIGKAVPAGARKGGFSLDVNHGPALYNRLKEHSESVTAACNLSLDDFACRFLVVDDIWIPLAESLLIQRFQPLWNRVVDGFGNHDPGRGRYNGKMPMWDCIHPGREWASRLQPCAMEGGDILTHIDDFLNEQFSG